VQGKCFALVQIIFLKLLAGSPVFLRERGDLGDKKSKKNWGQNKKIQKIWAGIFFFGLMTSLS
jgi:hypothetical protein